MPAHGFVADLRRSGAASFGGASDVLLKHAAGRFTTLALLAILSQGCGAAKQPAITETPTGTELPGKFVWHDLLTSDPAAAQRFYSGLFGWEFRQSDSGEYTVVTQAGRPIGGILDSRGGRRSGFPLSGSARFRCPTWTPPWA